MTSKWDKPDTDIEDFGEVVAKVHYSNGGYLVRYTDTKLPLPEVRVMYSQKDKPLPALPEKLLRYAGKELTETQEAINQLIDYLKAREV